jgi:hypothetical protein
MARQVGQPNLGLAILPLLQAMDPGEKERVAWPARSMKAVLSLAASGRSFPHEP